MASPVDLANEILAELDAGRPDQRIVTLASEVLRLHAEQAAGREHVERVVREAYDAVSHDDGVLDEEAGDVIACRVADRLSVPVLSAEDVALLRWMGRSADEKGYDDRVDEADYNEKRVTGLALIDRLIAGAKP